MDQERFLSIDEVADRLGVNTSTVYRLARSGGLPCFKLGGQWRFSESMLRDWVVDRVNKRKINGSETPEQKNGTEDETIS